MKILRKIDNEVLAKYVSDGLIIINTHPTFPLRILNYSRQCQFTNAWDDYTMSSRGLIIDNDGNIIARAYYKFLNIEQHTPEEIPNLPFEVFNKEDGSMLIIFYYDSMWHTATRGSFNSDQAIKGYEMLLKRDISTLDRSYTYLGEVVYPSNRIVCDYGDVEDIILHGVLHTTTGDEILYDEISEKYSSVFTIVKKYDGINDLSTLRDVQDDNREGYVIRFSNGFRVKAKFEEYCRLHSIVTNVSNVVVWEYLKDGKPLDELIDRTPDEFDAFVLKTVAELKDNFKLIEDKHRKKHAEILYYNVVKKEYALKVLELKGYNTKILFNMYDEREYADAIWRMIKPKWCRPFIKNVDEEL